MSQIRFSLLVSSILFAAGLFVLPVSVSAVDDVCICDISITISECFPKPAEGAINYNTTSGAYELQHTLAFDGSQPLSTIHDVVLAHAGVSCTSPAGTPTDQVTERNAVKDAFLSGYTSRWDGLTAPITPSTCGESDSYTSTGQMAIVTCNINGIPPDNSAPPELIVDEDAYVPVNFDFPSAEGLNPLPSGTTIPILIGRLLRTFTGIFGSVALLMIIYGGVTIMVSRAKGDEVKKGANIVLWASLGLIAMMASYALVQFVFSAIGG